MDRAQIIERTLEKHRDRIVGKGLTTSEVAELTEVSEATIKRWADAGKINCIRTAGKHRFFSIEAVIDAIPRIQASRHRV